MPTTTTPAFAVGDVVTIKGGTHLWDVTEVNTLDGEMCRLWPMDRDDDRTGIWQYADQLVKVAPDLDEAGRYRGSHYANGYGYCRECRMSLANVASEPECESFEVA